MVVPADSPPATPPAFSPAEAAPASKLDDDALLAKMGYRQELHRGFNGVMNFAFCFTSVAVLSSLSTAWVGSMGMGGPSVMIWGWLITTVFTICAGFAMAELCSAFPSAGSVYHWSAMLAPRQHSALACYITGVFNFIGNAAGDAGFAWGFAAVVATAVNFRSVDAMGAPTGPLYDAGAQVGVAIAVCAAWSVINLLRVDQQGWLNNLAALWQLTTTVAIIVCVITIPARDPDIPLNWVWTTSYNSTGIDEKNFGYVCLIGLLSALFAFSGYEAAGHMAEETTNSSRSAAFGLYGTCILVAATGFTYILGMLYATPSIMGMSYKQWAALWQPGPGAQQWTLYDADGVTPIESFLFNPTSGTWQSAAGGSGTYGDDDSYAQSYKGTYYTDFVPPWDRSVGAFLTTAVGRVANASSIADIYFTACGWHTGMVLTVVLIINLFFAGISSLTVTTRIGFALVRDGALPGSATLRYIWPLTKSPVGVVALTFLLDFLMMLLPLATTTALSAVLSICVIGYQISYAIPILLRLTPTGRANFRPGAFSLGAWSLPVHAVGGTWLFLTSFIFLWPTAWPVMSSGQKAPDGSTVSPYNETYPDNMNYTVVVVFVVFVVALVYWVVWARHHFGGPLRRMEDEAARASAAAAAAGSGGSGEMELAEVGAAPKPSLVIRASVGGGAAD